MNFDEIFDPVTEVRAEYRGKTFFHQLRNATTDEWAEYSRRLSELRRKGKSIVASETSALARIWLLKKLRTGIEIQNGTGREKLPQEYWDKLPPDHDDAVALAYLSQTQIDEIEEEKKT